MGGNYPSILITSQSVKEAYEKLLEADGEQVWGITQNEQGMWTPSLASIEEQFLGLMKEVSNQALEWASKTGRKLRYLAVSQEGFELYEGMLAANIKFTESKGMGWGQPILSFKGTYVVAHPLTGLIVFPVIY